MGAAAIKEAIARVPGLDGAQVDDVIMGCAMPKPNKG
jgi:acetyl-CoA acyltransferase